MPIRTVFVALALLGAAWADTLPRSTFDYDRSKPLDIQEKNVDRRNTVEIHDITFASLRGGRTAAYLVRASGSAKTAGILFVHWYDPPSKDSNRMQFLEQATELAALGATSLLIETMWSEPSWFPNRNRADDYANSIHQVKDLRRALDVLASQPSIDTKRIAYVGHDFGAMYGAVLAGVDHRTKAWALQAGTPSFSDWFLLGTKLTGTGRQAVIDELAPLDPGKYIGAAKPAPVFFQFGRQDRFVPEDRAQSFFDSANKPKSIVWYEAGHDLNAQAIRDRQAWLIQQLALKK